MVRRHNIHIEDSWTVGKAAMEGYLDVLRQCHPESAEIFAHRSMASLVREWVVHNALYRLGLFRSHTKDVDLEWPQPWYMRLIYDVLGSLLWLVAA